MSSMVQTVPFIALALQLMAEIETVMGPFYLYGLTAIRVESHDLL